MDKHLPIARERQKPKKFLEVPPYGKIHVRTLLHMYIIMYIHFYVALLMQLQFILFSKSIPYICIAGKFGGKKVWQIWQIMSDSPN